MTREFQSLKSIYAKTNLISFTFLYKFFLNLNPGCHADNEKYECIDDNDDNDDEEKKNDEFLR